MAVLTVEQKCVKNKNHMLFFSCFAHPHRKTVWDHYLRTEVHDYFDSNIS